MGFFFHTLFYTMINTLYKVPNLIICDQATPFPLSDKYCFRFEEEIKKSQFITSIGHANSKESAKIFIEKICQEFPTATHNCYAFAVGAPKDTANIGQSDNGEPHGTAGKPMLNILLHSDIGEIVAVVTRFFGGIKLGTGGLVKAYQSGVITAIERLPIIDKIIYTQITFTCSYEHINLLHHYMPNYSATIVNEIFSDIITYTIKLPEPQVQAFITTFSNATNGKIKILNTIILDS